MRKVYTGKIDWLRLEARMRAALRLFKSNEDLAIEVVLMVSDILGEETGRGFELAELTNTDEMERKYPDIYPKQEV